MRDKRRSHQTGPEDFNAIIKSKLNEESLKKLENGLNFNSDDLILKSFGQHKAPMTGVDDLTRTKFGKFYSSLQPDSQKNAILLLFKLDSDYVTKI